MKMIQLSLLTSLILFQSAVYSAHAPTVCPSAAAIQATSFTINAKGEIEQLSRYNTDSLWHFVLKGVDMHDPASKLQQARQVLSTLTGPLYHLAYSPAYQTSSITYITPVYENNSLSHPKVSYRCTYSYKQSGKSATSLFDLDTETATAWFVSN